MSEQTRLRPREGGGPHSGGHPLSGDDPLGNLAYVVSSGGRTEALPIAFMTVGEIRRRLADRLNIDPTAQAMIGTTNVADDVVLRPGEHLFFRRQAGEKGQAWPRWFRPSVPRWFRESLRRREA